VICGPHLCLLPRAEFPCKNRTARCKIQRIYKGRRISRATTRRSPRTTANNNEHPWREQCRRGGPRGRPVTATRAPTRGAPTGAPAGRPIRAAPTKQKPGAGFPGRAQLVSFNFKNKVICATASSAGGATVARMEPIGRREAPPDDRLRAIRGRRSRIALRSMRATRCPTASPSRSPARSSPTSPASAPRERRSDGARR
jgi:hypothetical protein